MTKVVKWKVVCETNKHGSFNFMLTVDAQSECEARSKAIVRLYNDGCSCIKIVSCTRKRRGGTA